MKPLYKMSLPEMEDTVMLAARQAAMVEYQRRHPGCTDQAAWAYALANAHQGRFQERAILALDYLWSCQKEKAAAAPWN